MILPIHESVSLIYIARVSFLRNILSRQLSIILRKQKLRDDSMLLHFLFPISTLGIDLKIM
jgi:hypothetical protein